MRSSSIYRSVSLIAALVVLSCGGSQPAAKSGDEAKGAETPARTEEGEKPVAEEKAASKTDGEKTEAAAETPASAGPACTVDTKDATSKIGTVKIITGCLEAKKALKILEQYFPQLHACFTNELKANRKAKGEVNVKINVGQKGTYSVRVHKDDVTTEEFVTCMVDVLRPLPYPTPEAGGATIEFSTNLK